MNIFEILSFVLLIFHEYYQFFIHFDLYLTNKFTNIVKFLFLLVLISIYYIPRL